MSSVLEVQGLAKSFTMHHQHGAVLNILQDLSFTVMPGECLVLHGRSGAGKSTLLRTLYGNYLPQIGSIKLRHEDEMVEMVGAEPRQIIDIRRRSMGYVSQFLRVIPRVSCLNVVMEPALQRGIAYERAKTRAQELLQRLSIPERLWPLAPGTFSGGEQQRVNIARSFMVAWPLLLLDEPTASLDDTNSAVVLELIAEAKAQGSALLAISHEQSTRDAMADRYLDMTPKELADVS